MKVLQILIDKNGTLISPTTIAKSNIDAMVNPPTYNQITCIFYNSIQNINGIITPTDPVTSGLSGTIQLQARTTADSAWSNIEDGSLDLSTGENMAFPSGAIQSIQALCTSVSGCNYILIRMDRGA